MERLRHLLPTNTSTTELYVYPRDVYSGEFKTPPRDDRVGHASSLVQQLQSAEEDTKKESEDQPAEQRPKGVLLEFFSDPSFKLRLQSLDRQQSGIELCNARIDENNVMHATVFVPDGKIGIFVRQIEAYAKDDSPSGKPKNKDFVNSVSSIRKAALASFWTDAGQFPQDLESEIWWEVWLRADATPGDVADQFRTLAAATGVQVGLRTITFPDRRVLLAKATIQQLMQVENLFDLLAELRLAKRLATQFVDLAPREQAKIVEQAMKRITWPSDNAPAVCHLDTGVNRSHPLLAPALAEDHVTACDPDWSPSDLNGHGTEMAGLALFGCLTELLDGKEPVELRHRLESVKILPDSGENDPDLYGEITNQAASRIEIISPERARAFCLTVTADSRDEGLPSSWSGAIDALTFGASNEEKRLIVVSAGNTPLEERHEYPNRNELSGVEDPSQAWNALAVGAYTEKGTIQSAEYANWKTIADSGCLSPGSRTSVVWQDKRWPLKPDIVMEGGNNAINPATKTADFVDDLSLLTTRVSATGALFTTTGDTSAATALASRYAAIIQSRYPEFWPETVRGILIHSARWTDAMLVQYPHRQRHARLRCYGYGVPDLERALWSANNATTLVIQEGMQPFCWDDEGKKAKHKDMHFHKLPWPKKVLQDLGETSVKLRVTLSYFIEPSPGRRGWTRKHRYQSFGLRFDVKQPLETLDEFRKRLSKSTRAEDEEVEHTTDDGDWELGPNLRKKGSVHSDTWTGSAAELAERNALAIFPVTGWWRERRHLGKCDSKARYSLVVSIETEKEDVEFYVRIANALKIEIPTQ